MYWLWKVKRIWWTWLKTISLERVINDHSLHTVSERCLKLCFTYQERWILQIGATLLKGSVLIDVSCKTIIGKGCAPHRRNQIVFLLPGVPFVFIYESDLESVDNLICIRVMVFKATFYNISVISWRSIVLVEETRVPREKHWSASSHWQTLSRNVVSSTPRHEQGSNSQR